MRTTEQLMKACQIGCSNLNDANSLLAECYGRLGRLNEENERMRNDAATKAMRMLQAEYKEMAQQVAELRLDLRRYQEREATMGWNQS